MSRTQIEILIEMLANVQIQLSAALARESELKEMNEQLAYQLTNKKEVVSAEK